MGEVELKPCPFCGGEAAIERLGDNRRSTIISCVDCGCCLENGETFKHGTLWNTRTPPRPDEGGGEIEDRLTLVERYARSTGVTPEMIGVPSSTPQAELERFSQFTDGWGDEVLGLKQHPKGEYVKYSDHQATVDLLVGERDEARIDASEKFHLIDSLVKQRDEAELGRETVHQETIEECAKACEAAQDDGLDASLPDVIRQLAGGT